MKTIYISNYIIISNTFNNSDITILTENIETTDPDNFVITEYE